MLDKYSADLDQVVERATTVLAEQFADVEQLTKRRDMFEAQIHQIETAIQQKVTKLKFLVDLHANELLDTLGDVSDAGLKKYQEAKSAMEKCHQLTEGFRQYAVEVIRLLACNLHFVFFHLLLCFGRTFLLYTV